MHKRGGGALLLVGLRGGGALMLKRGGGALMLKRGGGALMLVGGGALMLTGLTEVWIQSNKCRMRWSLDWPVG